MANQRLYKSSGMIHIVQHEFQSHKHEILLQISKFSLEKM